MSSRGDTDV